MKKLITGILSAICVCACVGSFAMNSVTANAAPALSCGSMTEMENPPACELTLEEAKVKNMTDWGYYDVDGQEVWYFMGDGTATADPEIRFITEGTQTVKNPYTLIPQTVEKFSFDYRIVNDGATGVVDVGSLNYIVQILASDGSYPIINANVIEDGEWHTITIDATTPLYSSAYASRYGQISDMFCGFLFKMGGLEGEFMIANIEVVFEGEEDTTSEDNTSEGDTNSSGDTASSSQDKNSTSQDKTSDLVEEPQVKNNPLDDILAKIGCSSVIGGSTVMCLTTLFGAAILLKKKEDR